MTSSQLAPLPAPWTLTPRILCVDDDPMVLLILRRVLSRARPSWEIACVESGAAALEALAGRAYDVLVTDLEMPHMSGFELLERVAARHPMVARVVHSGIVSAVDPSRFRSLADAVVPKPADLHRLLGALEGAFLSTERQLATGT